MLFHRIILRFYQLLLSPALHSFFGPSYGCRFLPTCSEYAQEAYEKKGFMRGTWLTICRLSRCHPFARAGYDPVPHAIGMKNSTNFDQL